MTTDDAPLAPLPPGWDLRDEQGAPLQPLAAADRAHAGVATHGCDEFRDLWAHAPGAAELTVGDLPLPRTPDGWWRLRFENRAGLATLRARDAAGREVAPPVTLYVRTAKLASVADHVAFLDRLLDDLFARATRLPFVAAASTAQPAREHHRPADALLAFHVLCAEAAALQTALRLIAVAPHRRLASEEELADLPRVRRLDTAGLLAVARAPELAALHGRADRATLAARPPSAIPHRRSEETRDTPENRFVAHAMREIRERLRTLPRQAWWGSVPAAPRRTLAALDEALAATLREPWLRALPPMTRLPGASRVLQRREGYRDLARIWSALHQARRPLFDHLAQAIATLDVASVYELWVFFRVADDLGRWAGVTPVLDLRPAASEGLRYGAQATIGTAGTLVYNATRHGYAARALRPDLLWLPAVGGQVALDAKFRLDRPLEPVAVEGEAGWNNDDIVKMHAYRDALPIRAAVVLYPGDRDGFWSPDGARQALTLHDLFAGEWPGVGAFSLRP